MRILTGSVLTLLVGSVAYLNLRGSGPEDEAGRPAHVAEAPAVAKLVADGPGPAVSAQVAPTTPEAAPRAQDSPAADVTSAPVPGERERATTPTAPQQPAPGGPATLAELLGVGGADAPVAEVVVAAGGLAGRVVDLAGAALAGVVLEAYLDGVPAAAASVSSDAEGSFRMTELAAGAYQVRVAAASLPLGFVGPWYAELCRSEGMAPGVGSPCVTVVAGEEVACGDLVLVRPGRVTGRVFGRDGLPANDALVRLAAVGEGLELCRAIAPTDANGEYALELVPGTYRLEAEFRPDGRNAGAPRFSPQTVVVTEGADVAALALRVPGTVIAAGEFVPRAKDGTAPVLPRIEPAPTTPVEVAVATAPEATPTALEGDTAELVAADDAAITEDTPTTDGGALETGAPVAALVDVSAPVNEELVPSEPVAHESVAMDAAPIEPVAVEPVAVEPTPHAAPTEPEPVVAQGADEAQFFVSTEDDFFASEGIAEAVAATELTPALPTAPTLPKLAAPTATPELRSEGLAANEATPALSTAPTLPKLAAPTATPELRMPRAGFVELELRGRVVSNFGEPLADVEVIATEGVGGEVRGFTTTDEDGQYTLEGATGAALHVVARGERLLAPSEPMPVRAEEGQRRVRVPDVLVEVRRVYHLRGRIVVEPSELEAFGAELAARIGNGVVLDADDVLRAYLRGLRLEQRKVGGRSGRTVSIGPDGAFAWSCSLPADDVEFVLEARGMRLGGRASRTTLVVTPAGDRTVEVELPFPTDVADDGSAWLAPETGASTVEAPAETTAVE